MIPRPSSSGFQCSTSAPRPTMHAERAAFHSVRLPSSPGLRDSTSSCTVVRIVERTTSSRMLPSSAAPAARSGRASMTVAESSTISPRTALPAVSSSYQRNNPGRRSKSLLRGLENMWPPPTGCLMRKPRVRNGATPLGGGSSVAAGGAGDSAGAWVHCDSPATTSAATLEPDRWTSGGRSNG
eukprot:6384605-Prymnesium_polylepis.3